MGNVDIDYKVIILHTHPWFFSSFFQKNLIKNALFINSAWTKTYQNEYPQGSWVTWKSLIFFLECNIAEQSETKDW